MESLSEKPNEAANNEEQPQKPKRPKTPVRNDGSSFWLIVSLLIVGFFLFNVFFQPNKQDIPFGSILQLIDRHAEKAENSFVDVEEGEGKNAVTARYTNLRKIEVGPFEIRGVLSRTIVAPPEKQNDAPNDVKFVSGRGGLNMDNNDLLKRLENAGFKDFRGESTPSPLVYYGPTILTLAILIPLMIYIFRRVGGSALAFGRNRSRSFGEEDVEITFDDVAGVDEAVDELREIVAFLQKPEKYKVLGGRIPRGVLLVGPPGTGKTILAKAIAGEAGVPFFSLSGSDFVELYVGVGAARVRDLFSQAEHQTPCIIFIDELDGLGKTRSSMPNGAHEEREQTLNALLVELDGIGTNTGIIVLAASNRPETLDPALLRPGRFDRHVLVDRPDIRGREAILKVHAKKVKLNESVDLREIASMTSGFVGADLAALVNEAALLAARAEKDSVTMEEFAEGVERVTAGLQKRQRVLRPIEKRRIAVHESGHALVALATPGADTVQKVSIIPRGLAALGYTLQRPEDDRYLLTKSELETRIKILLGGIIAEEILFEDVSTGAQNDLERATEIARSLVMDYGMSRLGRINYRENPVGYLGNDRQYFQQRLHSEKTAWEIDQEIKNILESLYRQTKEILQSKNGTLKRLAKRLLKKEVIETKELKRIVKKAADSSSVRLEK